MGERAPMQELDVVECCEGHGSSSSGFVSFSSLLYTMNVWMGSKICSVWGVGLRIHSRVRSLVR